MAQPVYFVGGSKGGVGKSVVSCALLDFLKLKGNRLLLIEADTNNPDVGAAYSEEVETVGLDLDDGDGWIELLNLLESKPEATAIINTPARNNQAVRSYGETLNTTLKALQREMTTLWVINRQRDSLELLKGFLETIENSQIVVVRNLHHGSEAKFELYNSSQLRREVESDRGGRTVNFPDMADRVADDLNCKRLSIARGIESLPIGNRAELERWRREYSKVFAGVIHD